MNAKLRNAIEALIREKAGGEASVANEIHAGGGCINEAFAVVLEDGRKFFVKTNARPLPGMFEREAEALEALAGVGAIRVPRPLGAAEATEGSPAFIVMENVESGRQGRDFMERFGRAFAELHRRSTGDRFGFVNDNYIGSTPQPNGWMTDWVEFWRERRLGHQLRLARDAGPADGGMTKCGERLMERLDDLIGEPDEEPCLLHGDLWGGNYLADERGESVLIDPAAYYGRREADLAMTYLFGGFNERFHRAYEESWPLADGSRERLDVYKLYHLLNHLNLFGAGYYGGCMAILQRYGK